MKSSRERLIGLAAHHGTSAEARSSALATATQTRRSERTVAR
jgi:hypothetical protein